MEAYLLPLLDTIAINDDIGVAHPLYKDFYKFKHLSCIYIATANLYDFPEHLDQLRFLEGLFIAAPNLKSIPKSVAGLKHLRYLSVQGNKLNKISNELFQLDSLENLSLIVHRLTKKDTIDFNKLHDLTMFELTSAKKIDFDKLFRNAENSHLEVLLICIKNLRQLPKELLLFKKLRRLYLIVDEPSAIDPGISSLKSLKNLTIHCKKTFTESEKLNLQKNLPGCTITFI